VSSFKAGFRNRHPLVLIAAVGLLVPALLGFQYFFTSGAWSVVPLRFCLRNRHDSFTYVSWTVGRNKRHPPAVPSVYVTGGSASREAIVSARSLALEIERLGGPAVAACDLGCIDQNFAETLAVADNVPASRAWVLIGVNLGRFTAYPAQNEQQVVGRDFLLRSPFLQHYVAATYGRYKYSYTILPGIFSYLASYLKQDGAQLFEGRVIAREYQQHQYTLAENYSAAKKQRLVAKWNTVRYPVFKRNRRYNLAMLEQILVRCRQRGVHAVLLELPRNETEVAGRFDDAVAQYRVPVRALAREYGVPYLDFNAAADIPSAYFHDLSHLVGPGRVIWQRRLAGELVEILGANRDGGAGRP
jgi:hypothetical protein